MKKSDHFTWNPEAQEALDSLKNMLKSPTILTAPTSKESTLLYISATTQVVSAALVVEREEPGRSQKVQQPVYFISEVLYDSKTRYSQMQKLVDTDDQAQTLALLRHAPHHCGVQLSTRGGHTNIEAEGRIAKWALELMG
jgi:hypothetical protein